MVVMLGNLEGTRLELYSVFPETKPDALRRRRVAEGGYRRWKSLREESLPRIENTRIAPN
jgi:hypothetical protein